MKIHESSVKLPQDKLCELCKREAPETGKKLCLSCRTLFCKRKYRQEQEEQKTPELAVPQCATCNGEEWLYMGILGFRAHLRCRACGTDVSVEVFQEDTESEG